MNFLRPLTFLIFLISCQTGLATISCQEIFQENLNLVISTREAFEKFKMEEQEFIPYSELNNLTNGRPAFGFQGIREATYKGHAVLLKLVYKEEAFFVQMISDLKTGPHVYGYTIPNPKHLEENYLVMEDLGNGSVQRRSSRDNNTPITQASRDNILNLEPWLKATVNQLSRRGVHVYDLQVYLNDDGSFRLIDAGYYQLEKSISSPEGVVALINENQKNYVDHLLDYVSKLYQIPKNN